MRYFFHVQNGEGRFPDDEGTEFGSPEEARTNAVEGIRSILAEEARKGRMDFNGRIEVTDAAGRELFRVHYQEAIAIVGTER
jgi:hypothetical protein